MRKLCNRTRAPSAHLQCGQSRKTDLKNLRVIYLCSYISRALAYIFIYTHTHNVRGVDHFFFTLVPAKRVVIVYSHTT